MRFASKKYKRFLSKRLKNDHSMPGFTKTWQPMYEVVNVLGINIKYRKFWQWFASEKELAELFSSLEFLEE